jgi:hypothetical protein
MSVVICEAHRPKRRDPQWTFRVMAGGALVFDSACVALRYGTREDAAWLAWVINRLAESWASVGGEPGLRPGGSSVGWRGDINDDCQAEILGCWAHAEHLYGPRRGGAWYCQVQCDGGRIFHTADRRVEPKNGGAARWLCEVLATAASLDILEPYQS